MNLTINSFTIEASLHSLYLKIGDREVVIQRDPKQPRMLFSRELYGDEMQLWGFGLYAVIPWTR
jgi:hypothetical protein